MCARSTSVLVLYLAGVGPMEELLRRHDGVRAARIVIVRSNGHVYAFALSCPHQNAAVKWVPGHNQFECTKHDSHYTADGTHVSGRATRNMDRMPVRKDGNMMHVDTAHVFQSDKDAAGWNAATVTV